MLIIFLCLKIHIAIVIHHPSYCPLNCLFGPVVKLSGYFISIYLNTGIQDKTQEFVKKKKDGREKEEKKMNKFLFPKKVF